MDLCEPGAAGGVQAQGRDRHNLVAHEGVDIGIRLKGGVVNADPDVVLPQPTAGMGLVQDDFHIVLAGEAGQAPGRLRRRALWHVHLQHVHVQGHRPIQEAQGELPSEVGGGPPVGLPVVVDPGEIHLEGDGHGRNAVDGPLEGRAHGAGDRDGAADVLTVVDARHHQVRLPVLAEGLEGVADHGGRRRIQAVGRHLMALDPQVHPLQQRPVPPRVAAPHGRLLVGRGGDQHLPDLSQCRRRGMEPRRGDAVVVGEQD